MSVAEMREQRCVTACDATSWIRSTGPRRRRMTTVWRGFVPALLAGILLLLVAPSVQAHPSVLATSPQAGYSITRPPQRVEVVFDESVAVADRAVRLTRDDGSLVTTAPLRRLQGGRRLVLGVDEELPPGRYVVRWTVTAQDGDVVDGGFDFAVAGAGDTSAATSGLSAGTAGLCAAVMLRWLLFAGLVLAVGGWVGERIAARARRDRPAPLVVAPLRLGAALGVLAAVGLLIHQAGRGSLLAGVPALLRGGLPGGPAARIVLAELVLFTAAGLLARRWPRWATAALFGVVLAEAFRNHLSVRAGVLGAVLMATHLLAVCAWVGGLVQVLRTARVWRAKGLPVRALLARYARVAFWLFVLVVATGTVASLLLVPTLNDLVETTYGRVLLVKIGLVVLVAVLALAARAVLPRGEDVPPGLLRRAAAERAVLVLVLAASATLVSLPAITSTTADVGYPVAASGPVVRLGTLTGQVSAQIAASENLLEVRLRTPDADPLVSERPPAYRIAARVLSPGNNGPRTVALRPCGPGCFLGPVAWERGVNSLDLRVDVPGWHGGAAVFAVPWPPRTDDTVLRAVVAAMQRAERFGIREVVTSDTSRPAPPAQTVTVTAEELLASDPYGDGSQVTDVVLLPRPHGSAEREIAFGLPAEGVSVRMVIDRSGRILRESIAAPKHLTERTFGYD